VRISFLCTDVEIPILGDEGCSVKIRQFCDTLAAQGHDVTVACAWLGEGEWRTGVNVIELEPDGASAATLAALERDPAILEANLERDLRSLAINHWLLSAGADLLDGAELIYERYALFGFAGAEVAHAVGAAHLLELNSPLCREQEGYVKFPLIRTAERLETEILRQAGAVIAVSPWLREYALEAGAEDVHLVPNGVASVFDQPASGVGVRARLGLGDAPVVGYVGSFQHWHDLEGLVHAVLRLSDDVRLLFVGHGPARERVEAVAAELGISERTVFAGHVDPGKVPEHLAAMTAAVVPYRPTTDFYFSPLKLFECMAAGVPTVAAAIGQIEEVIDDGKTGLLYAPGDGDALAGALRRVVSDPRTAKEIGAAGRKLVLDRHTMAANVNRVVALAERQRTLAAQPA
jgi:glycosyltransferase involved in cell wall biosynthesis